jgi:hydroxymethylglutaryl-CoA reductase (NADPH)
MTRPLTHSDASETPAFTRGELTPAFFRPMLAAALGRPDLEVTGVELLAHDERQGLSSRLGRARSELTLAPARLTLGSGRRAEQITVMVKSMGRGVVFSERLAQLFASCSERLAEASARTYRLSRGRDANVREPGVYRAAQGGLREVMPRLYGVHEDPERDAHVLVIEHLGDQVLLMNSIDHVADWRPRHVDAALSGIARAHATWFGREQDLLAQPWHGRAVDLAGMVERSDFWLASAEYVGATFPSLLGCDWLRQATFAIEALPSWWAELERMPRTLTHGDFTPRNLALREHDLRLVAYDWEYATLHLPQRDVVEFLAHVLPPHVDEHAVGRCIETHRRALERAAGVILDPVSWRRGFRLALADFVLTRFTAALVLHSAIEHRFVERLAATTMRLIAIERRRGGSPPGWNTCANDGQAA